jgi:hypothetical protein
MPPLGAPLNEPPKAGDRNNGLVDRFCPDLLAGNAEDFAADVLYVPHAQLRRPIMRMPAPIISLTPKPPALSLAASRTKALAPPSLAKSGRTVSVDPSMTGSRK